MHDYIGAYDRYHPDRKGKHIAIYVHRVFRVLEFSNIGSEMQSKIQKKFKRDTP